MVRGFFNDSFGMAEPAGPHIPNSKRARTRSADERNVPFNSGKIRRPGQSNFLRFNVIGLISSVLWPKTFAAVLVLLGQSLISAGLRNARCFGAR